MNLRQQLKTIAMKEFRGFVNSPWAYVIMVPFLLITHFLFFRTALVLGDANLRPLIELLPWFLMVIGPALAMRSFSDEQKKGTTELLLAHPVSEWTIVLGKFLGLWGFYALMLGATLVLPLILGIFSTPDWGMMAGQYWGAFLTGTTFLAVGMATSALMGNAIGGFLLGVAVNFVLMITGMGMILLMLPGLVGRFVAELSLLSHLTNFSRGVIDLRDGLYFFTITVIAATLTTLKLTERKVAESRKERNKLGVIILIVLGIGIIGNLLLYEFPLRLDLTADKRYSLSRGTKELLKTLPDRVTITLYTSDNLPGPTQVVLRQTSDVLGDFEGRSKRIQIRKVTVSTQDMSQRMEVQQKGIQEIQFNQIANSGFQVQTGYLGLEIRYGDKTEVIPYVSDATNLEYDLARKILRLTKENLGKIGLINVAESESRSALTQLLTDQYQVVDINETTTGGDWKDFISVIVVDNGSNTEASVSAEFNNYIRSNGGVAWFIDGVNVNQQTLSGQVSQSAYRAKLAEFGIEVHQDLVFDWQQNEAITLGAGNNRYILSYPFWIRPTVVNEEKIGLTLGVRSAVLGWPSSIGIENREGFTIEPFLTSSQLSGTQTQEFNLRPDELQKLPKQKEAVKVLGAMVRKGDQKMVVVADTQILSDDFLANSGENQTLVGNLIDWTAADPILSQIPKRTESRNGFKFSTPTQVLSVQWVGVLMPPMLVASLGAWWLNRRKRLSRRVYS